MSKIIKTRKRYYKAEARFRIIYKPIDLCIRISKALFNRISIRKMTVIIKQNPKEKITSNLNREKTHFNSMYCCKLQKFDIIEKYEKLK